MNTTENRKYYLGLLPETTGLTVTTHCTHAYLGTVSDRNLIDIIKKVDLFFRINGPVTMPLVTFDEPKYFDHGTRVLTSRNLEAFLPLKPLRQYFEDNKMISTKYPFMPHVNTGVEQYSQIDIRFKSYALVKKGFVVTSWPIHQDSEDFQ